MPDTYPCQPPLPAAHAELAAERLAKAMRDHQPEAAAAVEAGDPPVGLRVGLEPAPERRLGDAGPGVLDLDPHPDLALGRGSRPDAQRDMALLGELQRVAGEVDQDLA